MQGKAHSSARWPGQSVPSVGREDGTGGRTSLPAARGHVTCHPPCHHGAPTIGERGAEWDAELQMRAERLVLQAAGMNNGARNRHG